jgi:hypothetical protein
MALRLTTEERTELELPRLHQSVAPDGARVVLMLANGDSYTRFGNVMLGPLRARPLLGASFADDFR